MVSALLTQAPAGSTRRGVLHAVSADTGLDVAYTLMVREIAEASNVSYRRARDEVDKSFIEVVPKSQEQLDHERMIRSIRAMSKYRKG